LLFYFLHRHFVTNLARTKPYLKKKLFQREPLKRNVENIRY